jgi:hypothetical protein
VNSIAWTACRIAHSRIDTPATYSIYSIENEVIATPSRFLLTALLAAAPSLMAQSLAGLWDATVNVNGLDVPFRMELSGVGQGIQASFFNGDEKVTSTERPTPAPSEPVARPRR